MWIFVISLGIYANYNTNYKVAKSEICVSILIVKHVPNNRIISGV
jgi:hypothetical protein